MDNEEKNLNDTLTEMVKVELSSNTETIKDELNSTEEIESENNTFDGKIEIKDEELDTNVDEVINNIENKEENHVDDIVTSNNEDSNSDNKNKKGNSVLPIIVLAILIVIGICAYFVYDQYIREDNKEKTNGDITPTPSVAVQVTPTPIPTHQNEINNKYECKKNDCVINQLNDKIQIIIDGNDVVIYNFQENNILDEINDRDVQKIYNGDYELVGLSVVNEDDKYAYYDISRNEYITDFVYDYFEVINEKLVASAGSGCINSIKGALCGLPKYSDNQVLDIIDISTKKLLYHKDGKWTKMQRLTVSTVSSPDNNYQYYVFKPNNEYDIFNSNFEIVASSAEEPIVFNDGSLIVNKTKYYEKYNSLGEKIYTSSNYNQLMFVRDDGKYIAVVDNDELKLIDLDENIIVKFDNWNSKLNLLSSEFFSTQKFSSDITDEGIYIETLENLEDEIVHVYYYNLSSKETKDFMHARKRKSI